MRLRSPQLTVPRRTLRPPSHRRPPAHRIRLPLPTPAHHRRAPSTLRPVGEHPNHPHHALTLRRRTSPSPADLSTAPASTHPVPRPRLPLRNLSPLPLPFPTNRDLRRRDPRTIHLDHETWATTTHPDPTVATPPLPQPHPVATTHPASPLPDTTPSTAMAHRTRRTMNRRRPSPTSPWSTGTRPGTTRRSAGTHPKPTNQQVPQHLTRRPRSMPTRRQLDPTSSRPRRARRNTLTPLQPDP